MGSKCKALGFDNEYEPTFSDWANHETRKVTGSWFIH